MQQIRPAKKLTKSSDIRKAFNWLFHDITPAGPAATFAMLEIIFLKERTGVVGKDTPNGEKAIALFTSNMLFTQAKFEQPIPPPLGLKDLTVQVYFFMNEWLYIEAKSIDFTANFEGQSILSERIDEGWGKMYFVSVQNLFRLAIASAEIENTDTLETSSAQNEMIVTLGKSSYKVIDFGGELYKIMRTDNFAIIDPKNPHGRRAINAYKEQKARGVS